MEFSELIKIKRETANIRLVDLEKETGITASYIGRIEKGQIKGVSAEYAFKLANALNIPISEISECFGIKLHDNNNQMIINRLKNKEDYKLIRESIECLLDISNFNKVDDIFKLNLICRKLIKDNVTIIATTDDGNADYAIELVNDKFIINFVKRILRERLSAKTKVIEGNIVDYDNYINFYKLEEFIEEFVEDDSNKEEIKEYIKKNKYL